MADGKGQQTFCDFSMGNTASVDIDMGDAFEFTDAPSVPVDETTKTKPTRKPELRKEPSVEYQDEEDSDDDEVPQLGAAFGQAFGELGKVMGQTLIGNQLTKEGATYKIMEQKYLKLVAYLEENEETLSPELLEKYGRTCGIMEEYLEAFDKYKNPTRLNERLGVLNKRMNEISEPYPPEINYDDATLQSELVGEVFGNMGQMLQEGGEDCCVM